MDEHVVSLTPRASPGVINITVRCAKRRAVGIPNDVTHIPLANVSGNIPYPQFHRVASGVSA